MPFAEKYNSTETRIDKREDGRELQPRSAAIAGDRGADTRGATVAVLPSGGLGRRSAD
jgi:hypothetical protein